MGAPGQRKISGHPPLVAVTVETWDRAAGERTGNRGRINEPFRPFLNRALERTDRPVDVAETGVDKRFVSKRYVPGFLKRVERGDHRLCLGTPPCHSIHVP